MVTSSMKETTHTEQLPHVVTIGGGTGHSVILSGLRKRPVKLTAIVSMADDGSSGGMLRDELGVLPPGDIRMCLVALSGAPDTMRQLFQYRFAEGSMKGHTVGNMFLAALEKITGSFPQAVAMAGKILNVYGRVVPVSEDDMRLLVTLKDGTVLRGEKYLNDNEEVRAKHVDHVALEKPARASARALEAIEKADVIILGPGGLYDSLLPNLLVDGISEAIHKSKARVLYVANLTNKMGQTEHFTVHEYARALNAHIGNRINTVLINTHKPDADLLARYEAQEGKDTIVQCPTEEHDYTIVTADILADEAPEVHAADTIAKSRSLIRHDSTKLADAVMGYVVSSVRA